MHIMHDWTLKSVLFEWELARVTLILENLEAQGTRLVAEDVVDLCVPLQKEWGPSASVNKLIGPSETGNGKQKLAIEMQSGDTLVIIAGAFKLPA